MIPMAPAPSSHGAVGRANGGITTPGIGCAKVSRNGLGTSGTRSTYAVAAPGKGRLQLGYASAQGLEVDVQLYAERLRQWFLLFLGVLGCEEEALCVCR